jgi:hypothetical protein
VTGGGTEFIRLERNQRSLGRLPILQIVHAFLDAAHKAKYK